jgi:uncharacterized lipoprotein YehR (DUF1307 family)
MVILKIAFTLKNQAPEEEAKKMIAQLVEVYKKVPGLKQKYFVADPKTGEAGGIYVFEEQKALDEYLKSDVWNNIMLPIIKGEPKIETFIVNATLS